MMIEQLTTTQQRDDEINLPYINHRNRLSVNLTGSYKVNKLFYDSSSIKTGRSSVIERESEKEREIRLMENLNFNMKKLNKDYLDKLSDLLQSRRDPDYSTMRKHMDEIIYETDDNHNVHLTLPKCLKKKQRRIQNEYTQPDYSIKIETAEQKNTNVLKEQKQPKKDITKLIPEFDRANNDEMGNNMTYKNQMETELDDQNNSFSQLKEEDQKLIFDKLKTRNCFNMAEMNKIKNNTHVRMESSKKEDKTEIIKMFEVFNKYTDKAERLKNIRMKREQNKKFKLEKIDLFHYDKKRWEAKMNNKQLSQQNEEIRNKRDKTKKTLHYMMESYDKLNDMTKKIKSHTLQNQEESNKQKPSEKNQEDNTFLTSPDHYRYR